LKGYVARLLAVR